MENYTIQKIALSYNQELHTHTHTHTHIMDTPTLRKWSPLIIWSLFYITILLIQFHFALILQWSCILIVHMFSV